MDKIVVKGARENNLKNIDIELPKNKLIVMTGLSGSGKSSLAFDTIYQEGQRRFVESLIFVALLSCCSLAHFFCLCLFTLHIYCSLLPLRKVLKIFLALLLLRILLHNQGTLRLLL